MGVFSRIRDWFRELFGGATPDTDSTDERATDADGSRLDPDNVTEVRTDATDESVEKLQNLTRSSEEAPAGAETEE